MSVYDKYYLEPNHFGRPYADLMDYFEVNAVDILALA